MTRILPHIVAFLVVVFTISLNAQTISGVVNDESNLPIPGVNITIEGKTIGTTTDFDGKFLLEDVEKNDVIIFSYIGFENQKIVVDEQVFYEITLKQSTEALDEIIIVGVSLGKKDLTGAVVNVDEKTLQERPVSSINEALQGRAAGVFIQNSPTPGGNASIRIRGNNSIQYGGNPIFVVDGIIMDQDFNLTNLNDVASINVLKDASATALYGSRGANGVVVVSTKRGKKGEGVISYQSWLGIQDFKNENITLGAQDMFNLRIDALVNSQIANDYFSQFPNNSRQQFINEELLGEGSPWFADYELETIANGQNYNWLDQVTRTAIHQNHALSFSGGSDNHKYYISFGVIDEEGLILNSSNTRYTGRINAEQKIKPWLTVGTNTSYTISESQEVDGSVFRVARGANPMLPIERYRDTLFLAWGNNFDINQENPFNSLRIDRDRKRSKLATSNYIEATPLKNLTIRTTFAIDYVQQEYYEYIPSDIQQALRDSYAGRAIHNFDNTNYLQWDNSIKYDSYFGKHTLSSLFTTSLVRNEFRYTNVLARDFPTDDFSYFNLGSAFDKPNFNLGSDFIASTIMSYLARFNYNYDGRYFVTLSGRYDGSSKFADGNQWGFFPAASLAWNITNESFLQNQEYLNLAKLRLGYGSVGNQGIPDYAFFSLYNPVFSNEQVSFVSNGLRGTPGLTWEKQDQFNIGLDIRLFNNKINFTAEYFNIVNSNLLMRRTLSTITGYDEAIENVGEMTNRGFEFSISANIIESNDFNWNVSGNISFDKNKITQLYGDVDAIFNFGGFTGTDIQRTGNFFLGESLNSIYMWEFDRIIQEEDMPYVNSLQLPGRTLRPGDILPRDQQQEGEVGHGIIDEDDRVIVGTQDPDFYGGFSTEFTYKNISLNAVFTYSQGATRISSFYESLMSGTGIVAAHTDMLDRWTPLNTNTNIPRATYDNPQRFGAGETSWGLQDGSFVRLATLGVSYTFPKSITEKMKIQNLRFYVRGNNLFTWTNYRGYDPENGDFYPTARMFTTGIDVNL